jgi:Zn-dependent protease
MRQMDGEAKSEQPPRTLRPGALQVARIAGIPIYLTTSWILLALILILGYGPYLSGRHPGISAYVLGASIVVSLILTVLLHELGHAAAARRFRVGVRGITLELLGGYTELEREAPTPRAEAMIALAGPGVSFLLAFASGALLFVTDRGSVVGDLVFQLAATNAIVAIFNVLPGLPLDGGRALRAVVWRITRDPHRADVVASWGGRVIAIVTIVLGVALYHRDRVGLGLVGLIFFLMVAMTMWRGANQSLRYARVKQRIPEINAGAMARPLHLVPSRTPLAEALRQRDEAQPLQVVIGIEDASGRVIGLVNPRAVAAVPIERRPWISVDEVARVILPEQRITSTLSGTDLLTAVAANPDADLLVTVGEDVVGVLLITDVITMLNT